MPLPEYERLAALARTSPSTSSTILPIMDEVDAEGEVALLYDHFRTHFGRPEVPDLLKCFATHPPLLRHMMELAETLLFSDGYLTRRQKEMIATSISLQNNCAYCADSHSYFLRIHGGSSAALHAILSNNLSSPALTPAEQSLLHFVQQVNRASSQITHADVDLLYSAGWSEWQAAEAVHIAALFASFNRVANAFGLQSQELLSLYEIETATPTPTAAPDHATSPTQGSPR
jgi:uncharacterized peroxidase-related enzyme